MGWLRWLWWNFARLMLALRYRVTVRGWEELDRVTGPILVLPNHPGYVDPPIVLSQLSGRLQLRPLVFEGMYRFWLFHPVMRLINALEVPDLSAHSQSARDQTQAIIDAVVAGIKRGERFLIYPSGRLQRQGREVVGAARSVAEILARCPEIQQVVLVQTQGLWGSSFSFAYSGALPPLGARLVRAVAYWIANLFFFLPRRQVSLTLRVVERSELPGTRRELLNPFLEAHYNRDVTSDPVYVPYHFLIRDHSFEFPELASNGTIDVEAIKPEVRRQVTELISEKVGQNLEATQLDPTTPLDQLGLDSLDRMEVALAIEHQYGFRSDRVAATVGEMWALAAGQLRTAGGLKKAPRAWRQEKREPAAAEILGETVVDAFVRRALANPDALAVADDTSGVLTYRKLLVGAVLLARRFRALPGEAVGVLLPASVAADVVFLALHFAGKLPVMLNWTTGPGNVAHALRLVAATQVITSRRLIDRLGLTMDGADFVFLEDQRGSIGTWERTATYLASYLGRAGLVGDLPTQHPDDRAVVLFTSGSEKAPKGVPLTHRNILSNGKAAAAVMQVHRGDTLLSFLPPFHSFGLSGTMIWPLLLGIRMVHHPDPTDAPALVGKIAAYRPTLLFATPTFVSYIFAQATDAELGSLRLIVTGAEKCPDALFEQAAQIVPDAEILEGYGITECAPVVSVNPPRIGKRGAIGRPLPGVEVLVVDPETNEPVPEGARGMLLVRGPNVFAGYLGEAADPFVAAQGQRWYRTGDLVQLDGDGAIRFAGRLKRFLKAGGEMVSLPALEDPFASRWPATQDGPRVAVEGVEMPDGARMVLFTTEPITLKEANALLHEAGFRGVMRLHAVHRLEKIPVLGTGKTDYKVLRQMIVDG